MLCEVFMRLREADLRVKLPKCVFGYIQLPFLGNIVVNSQISPDPSKIQSIRECSSPSSKKQVRCVLGLVGY